MNDRPVSGLYCVFDYFSTQYCIIHTHIQNISPWKERQVLAALRRRRVLLTHFSTLVSLVLRHSGKERGRPAASAHVVS